MLAAFGSPRFAGDEHRIRVVVCHDVVPQSLAPILIVAVMSLVGAKLSP
jgi:hypothetical protein